MQTFLPLPDYQASAQCLDRQRLGKQRVEAMQLLRALLGYTHGWVNHPAASMWRGYEKSLAAYGLTICEEWSSRGYVDNCAAKIKEYTIADYINYPWWFGSQEFHASHRSNLLRKMPEHYSRFGWGETDTLPYFWPKKIDLTGGSDTHYNTH